MNLNQVRLKKFDLIHVNITHQWLNEHGCLWIPWPQQPYDATSTKIGPLFLTIEPPIPDHDPIMNLQGARIFVMLGLGLVKKFMAILNKVPHFTFYKGKSPCRLLTHQIIVKMQMPPCVIYISTISQWVKLPTCKITLKLQLWLWYHQDIDSTMTCVIGFEC